MPGDPEAILAFWFGDAARDPAALDARNELWFGGSEQTDAEIRERFGAEIEEAASGELDSWLSEPRSALALVILLDQFPRNVWRGGARAFSCDAKALAVARRSVAVGHLAALAPIEQCFLVLPFQHSEALDDQREQLRLYREVEHACGAEWKPTLGVHVEFAARHLAVIERFGRFPHRNRALGRESNGEELAYLDGGGETFGQGEH
jgi:uncharacterized protein (DUF924 family)